MRPIDVSASGLRASASEFELLAWSENLRAFEDAAQLLRAAADRIEELESAAWEELIVLGYTDLKTSSSLGNSHPES